jgi:hypothetical protein
MACRRLVAQGRPAQLGRWSMGAGGAGCAGLVENEAQVEIRSILIGTYFTVFNPNRGMGVKKSVFHRR